MTEDKQQEMQAQEYDASQIQVLDCLLYTSDAADE